MVNVKNTEVNPIKHISPGDSEDWSLQKHLNSSSNTNTFDLSKVDSSSDITPKNTPTDLN